ncbi:MAG: hypothetical protein D6776_08270 [Planctomycetota bacterium]|nr:MAG: hypothetical protein D6776_08270 [Planctomycetota bacterium]
MTGRRRGAVCGAALLVLLAALAPAVAAEVVERVVAEVNGSPITSRDLRQALMLDEQWLMLRQRSGSYAVREMQRRVERRVLEQLIDEILLVQYAHRLGLRLTDAERTEADRAFDERAVADFGSLEALRSMLAERGVPLEVLRERHRNGYLIRKLLQREMATGDGFVRPVEIRRYYELQRAHYERPGKVVLRHILISKRRHGDKRARALAQRILERLRAGEDWNALAREFSDGARAEEGGRMELKRVDEIGLTPLREAVARLRPGEISGLIDTPRAVLIARLDVLEPPARRSFEEVQDEIALELRTERRQQALRRLKQRLRAQATIRLHLED